MRGRKKLRKEAGFTLAETLLAVLILLLVSGIVASGVPVVQNVFEKVVVGANAQVVLSNAVTALRYELGTARDVTVNTPTVTYVSAHTGAKSMLYIDGSEGIKLFEYIEEAGRTKEKDSRRLVSAASGGTKGSAKNLYLLYDKVEYIKGVATFKNLRVCFNTADRVLASMDSLVIRVIGEETAETTTGP